MISQLTFTPFLTWPWLTAFIALGSILLALSLWQRARGMILRIIAFVILIFILFNPIVIQERRSSQPDIAIAVVDESPSQSIEGRRNQNETILKKLQELAKNQPNFNLKIVRVQAAGADKEGDGTHLFGPLAEAIADVPKNQLAGIMLITDGQVHDVPKIPKKEDGKLSFISRLRVKGMKVTGV